MPENNSNNLENQPTEELSFEERVGRRLELILTQLAAMQAEQAAMREEQATLRTEMIERFVQLSRQIRDVDARVAKLEERFEDVSYKLDDFIKEQIWMKREWRELQTRQTAR